MDKILEVKNLKVAFRNDESENMAVDGITFDIYKGETLCIVGESGSGKSVTALSALKLVPTPPGRYVSGQIIFEGEDILKKSNREMAKIRGKNIAMIFQEPMTALNPVHRIGAQIQEALYIHESINKQKANKKVVEMLSLVRIPDAERCAKQYPHQLSGGMRQRVMIAMAFSCAPKLLIADEPTTALDVTIQAQILDIIKKNKEERGMTVLFITHDLGVVAEIAQRVIVMYAGKIVEEAPCKDLFANPLHPYTKGLMDCIPKIDQTKSELSVIKGSVPSPDNIPTGCRFNPRCPYCMDICKEKEPELITVGDRRVACHFIDDESDAIMKEK